MGERALVASGGRRKTEEELCALPWKNKGVAAAGVKINGVEVIEETRVFTESRVVRVRVRVRYRWVLDGLRDLD